MSLEQKCRRKPDTEGIPVRLRNGEDWLIPQAEVEPVFEKIDEQWIFHRFGIGKPYKERFERIRELWEQAAKEKELATDIVAELKKNTMELAAMALDQNYDLTAEQLGNLIDPVDQIMTMAILGALRGAELGRNQEAEEDEEVSTEEKKKNESG